MNDYIYVTELGKGAHGVVSLYVDKNDNSWAIKKISKNRMREAGHDLSVIEKEIAINRNLSYYLTGCNPHIVCYKGLLEDDDNYYIVQKYIKGVTLERWIDDFQDELANELETKPETKSKKFSGIPVRIIKSFMIQLLEGINTIHSNNYAHRDIKPENIIIELDTQQLYIIDFGYACNDSNFLCKGNPGSVLYAPPEIIANSVENTIDPNEKLYIAQKHDIWACGMIFYILAYLMYPFNLTSNIQEMMETIYYYKLEFPKSNRSDIDYIIKRMLSKEYYDRPSADEVLELINHRPSLPNLRL